MREGRREGRRECQRESRREQGRKEEEKKGGREEEREGGREGGRERGREGGRKEGRVGGREGGREEAREGVTKREESSSRDEMKQPAGPLLTGSPPHSLSADQHLSPAGESAISQTQPLKRVSQSHSSHGPVSS